MLQKTTECMEYFDILEKGLAYENSLIRIGHAIGFFVTPHGTVEKRMSKPFNPVLGETYEYKTKHF
jgi:hypothetical protein